MGLKHKAKPGTVVIANGVKVTVEKGSPLLDIAVPAQIEITIADRETDQTREGRSSRRYRERPIERTKENNPPKQLPGLVEGLPVE